MIRILLATLALCLVAFLAFVAGSVAGFIRAPVAKSVMGVLVDQLLCTAVDCGYDDTSDRSPVDCAPYSVSDPRAMVLLSLGQSNGANHGETPMTPRTGVDNFNPNDGLCYAAEDPLLGTTGNGGSPWTRLGDQLLAKGVYDRVLVVPIAVGGSRIERWAPGGDLEPRIARTAEALAAAGIRVTHVAWHQGESNSQDSGNSYTAAFGEVLGSLRGAGIDAPVFVAVATICNDAGSDEIRAAQAALPQRHAGVFAGPNSDSLNQFEHRHDLCHFSTLGLDLHAALWREALSTGTPPTSRAKNGADPK